jgi:deoxyribonuclease V
MEIYHQHSWEVTTEEAKSIQLRLKNKLIFHNNLDLSKIHTIAAADISYNRSDDQLYAAVVLLNYQDLSLIDVHSNQAKANFPYIPGFLSFREIPPLLQIFNILQTKPDILICDGQGIAHPRGLGLASHLGIILDIPTIGCAKSVLVGHYVEPSVSKGSVNPLIYQNRQVGAAVRTRRGVKPVFVSVGHKISLKMAVEFILYCSPRYRIPDPLRLAHRKVNELRKISTLVRK